MKVARNYDTNHIIINCTIFIGKEGQKMLENNNLLVFALAGLPVLLYSLLVYWILPKKYISKRRARTYFVAGLLSPTLVHFTHFIFPNWGGPVGCDIINILVFQAFVQVALLEESTKYITYFWVSLHRRNEKFDLPIATIYYSIMSASGFAIVENIYYLMNYGDKVLFIRGITAIVLHMICGLFMGYFIAKSKSVDSLWNQVKNQYQDTIKKYLLIKKWFYIFVAIITASFLHGVYDLNLFFPFNLYSDFMVVVILAFALFIGFLMLSGATKESREIREKNKKLYDSDIEDKKDKEENSEN